MSLPPYAHGASPFPSQGMVQGSSAALGAMPPSGMLPPPSPARGGAYGQATVPVSYSAAPKPSATPRNAFICIGAVLLTMLCVIPVWNAIKLLQDTNYIFWQGPILPIWMLGICVGTVVLYAVSVSVFFGVTGPQVQSEQMIMIIANLFITLLGMALILVSLPLSRESVDTYNNLMQKCDFSLESHRLYEYSQVLHNIRRTPDCIGRYSVEECKGYEEAEPYTRFLKVMEDDFHCTGFCHSVDLALLATGQHGWFAGSADSTASAGLDAAHNGGAAASKAARASGSSADAQAASSESQQETMRRFRRAVNSAILSVEDSPAPESKAVSKPEPSASVKKVSAEKVDSDAGEVSAPFVVSMSMQPIHQGLFSDHGYQASCDGLLARDMKGLAGDIGVQTFYQGVYLLLIAVSTGFLRLIGFCLRRDGDIYKPQY